LLGELVALPNKPLIAAGRLATQHFAIELQARETLFHLRNFARRFGDFPTVWRQTRQPGSVLREARLQPLNGASRFFHKEIGGYDHGATFRRFQPWIAS
jgi:hypothetical protein